MLLFTTVMLSYANHLLPVALCECVCVCVLTVDVDPDGADGGGSQSVLSLAVVAPPLVTVDVLNLQSFVVQS